MKVWVCNLQASFQRPYLLHQVKQLIVAKRRATPSQHGLHPHRPSYRLYPYKADSKISTPNQHQLTQRLPAQPALARQRIQSVLLTFFTYFNLGRD